MLPTPAVYARACTKPSAGMNAATASSIAKVAPEGVAAETVDPAHPTNWREACPPRCSGTDVAPRSGGTMLA